MRKLEIIIVANGGALLTGKPGAGQTNLLVLLIRSWKAVGPKTHVVCGAYTHAAARVVPGGRTLVHWRRAYN